MTAAITIDETKEARINLRARQDEKSIIERAAKLRGTSSSNFIMRTAVKSAKAVLEEAGQMVLDDDDSKTFVDAFLELQEASPYMKRAIANYKKG